MLWKKSRCWRNSHTDDAMRDVSFLAFLNCSEIFDLKFNCRGFLRLFFSTFLLAAEKEKSDFGQ